MCASMFPHIQIVLFCMIFAVTAIADQALCATSKDYPISPVSFTEVSVTDGFWSPRMETNRKVTVGYDFKKCEQTGRLDNFAVAGGLKKGGFQGIYYNDSDVYKVIEGAAYSLSLHPDKKLDHYLDELIKKIAAAQEDDGYLYTARTINDPKYKYPGKEGGRWSYLAHSHELYNVGHMYEAAVAHYLATGKKSLLNVAIKNADLVCQVFEPATGQCKGVPGHQEIEIGLARLYRVTGDVKYLQQAKYFLDMRGQKEKRGKLYGEYCQDHLPVIEQDEAVGHAVRAGYLYAGMSDVAALTGDQQYIHAVDRLWQNVVNKKLYLTGGIGSTRHGEAFGKNYELPNATAYNETCAAIANAMWNHRMFCLHGDAKYIDVLERILYNGFLSGISMSGDRFFYPNPLASYGGTQRSPWFGCSCCPVNVVRFMPSIPGYIYAIKDDAVYVNLYINGKAQLKLKKQTVVITQKTQYPWTGQMEMTIAPQVKQNFTLNIRIPGWAQGQPVPGDLYRYENPEAVAKALSAITLKVNGQAVSVTPDKGYVAITRTWSQGDKVTLSLPMPIRRVVAHPNVEADRDRVAFERGPIVYCFEAVDNDSFVNDLFFDQNVSLKAQHEPHLLGGVTVLKGNAKRLMKQKDGTVQVSKAKVFAIPYYAWAHRKIDTMAVWMPMKQNISKPRPYPTLASKADPSASHCWSGDTLKALGDQEEPKSSSDESIPRLTWWDKRGSKQWVQYTWPSPVKISSAKIYWFDDTGKGQCRVPKSWQLFYQDGKKWKPVQSSTSFDTSKDRYNVVIFEPIKTNALRLEVQLQQDYSGGILEWTVE